MCFPFSMMWLTSEPLGAALLSGDKMRRGISRRISVCLKSTVECSALGVPLLLCFVKSLEVKLIRCAANAVEL